MFFYQEYFLLYSLLLMTLVPWQLIDAIDLHWEVFKVLLNHVIDLNENYQQYFMGGSLPKFCFIWLPLFTVWLTW